MVCIRTGTGTGTGDVGRSGIVGKTGLTDSSGGDGEQDDDGGENDDDGDNDDVIVRVGGNDGGEDDVIVRVGGNDGGGCGFIVARISGGSGVEAEKFGSSLICFSGVMESCNGGCLKPGGPVTKMDLLNKKQV